ncbi:NUDIX domain-containing protein [Phyllobacterium leguminum]|uniref:NUDIX domain-containing protein n=1 Tax=Phyllobacterium leguminum TaxID=314237 RepID=UPI000DA22C1B|nr:NUDIX hydrolase [Phyllobacterium leguminum]
MSANEKPIRVRVAGIVFYEDEILIVEHKSGSEIWACYPGGRMESGEKPEDCLKRELFEELQLTCNIDYLAGIGDFIDNTSHNVEMFFKCTALSKNIIRDDRELYSAQFVKISSLDKWTVYPIEVTQTIPEIKSAGTPTTFYYGRFS